MRLIVMVSIVTKLKISDVWLNNLFSVFTREHLLCMDGICFPITALIFWYYALSLRSYFILWHSTHFIELCSLYIWLNIPRMHLRIPLLNHKCKVHVRYYSSFAFSFRWVILIIDLHVILISKCRDFRCNVCVTASLFQ